MTTECSGIEKLMESYLMSHIGVQQTGDTCVITLPIETFDKRWVGVFVEPRARDYFLVHDGGKAVNELILQGMRITPTVERSLRLIAGRFGISYEDEMFQSGGKLGGLPSVVYAVGMSSALAMANLLEHVPSIEEEPIETKVGVLLDRWGRSRAKITRNVVAKGEIKQHTFNFLLSPRGGGQPYAISVLHPTGGALSAAERYGFKSKDLENTHYGKWRRVAIKDKAELWTPEANNIIRKCANAEISVRSGENPTFSDIEDALRRAA
jgi:hypothetical protein